VAAGVAGLLICPLWFAMDFQGAAYKETAALQSRQNYVHARRETRLRQAGAYSSGAIARNKAPRSSVV
jgi:hypothetical protein